MLCNPISFLEHRKRAAFFVLCEVPRQRKPKDSGAFEDAVKHPGFH